MTRPRFNAPGERAAARARIERRRDNERTTRPKPCRVCGAPIRFVQIDGRWRVLDADRASDGTIVWLNGEIDAFHESAAPERYKAIAVRYRLHTCPKVA